MKAAKKRGDFKEKPLEIKRTCTAETNFLDARSARRIPQGILRPAERNQSDREKETPN
jgi:hypothetical protein